MMMDNFRVRLASWAPLAFRFGLGFAFMVIGWGKFHGLLNGQSPLSSEEFGRYHTALGWMLGTTEFVGGLCLVLGLLTRFWSAGMGIAMTVAVYSKHWPPLHDTFKEFGQAVAALFHGQCGAMSEHLDAASAAFRSPHSGQTAYVFGAVALGLFLMGPGPVSLDHLIGLIFRRGRANPVVGPRAKFGQAAEPDAGDEDGEDGKGGPASLADDLLPRSGRPTA